MLNGVILQHILREISGSREYEHYDAVELAGKLRVTRKPR
jgi:hypothetical protein